MLKGIFFNRLLCMYRGYFALRLLCQRLVFVEAIKLQAPLFRGYFAIGNAFQRLFCQRLCYVEAIQPKATLQGCCAVWLHFSYIFYFVSGYKNRRTYVLNKIQYSLSYILPPLSYLKVSTHELAFLRVNKFFVSF